MFENNFLSLSGYGRIYEIGYGKGDVCITLHLINECNSAQADDLWVMCQVNICDFPEIAKFESYLAKGKSITVKFDAQYLSFQQGYSGMAENDPNFILHLQGRLLKIHEYYVEDDSAISQHMHGITKHMMSHQMSHQIRA